MEHSFDEVFTCPFLLFQIVFGLDTRSLKNLRMSNKTMNEMIMKNSFLLLKSIIDFNCMPFAITIVNFVPNNLWDNCPPLMEEITMYTCRKCGNNSLYRRFIISEWGELWPQSNGKNLILHNSDVIEDKDCYFECGCNGSPMCNVIFEMAGNNTLLHVYIDGKYHSAIILYCGIHVKVHM